MSDFNGTDYDFAAGSVLGLRSWDIDMHGRLHGITHREVWRPGENLSVCKKTREIPCPNPPQPKPSVPRDRLPATTVPTPKVKKKGRNRRHSEVLAPWERELLYGPPMQGPVGRCDDPACYGGHHVVGSDHRFDPNCDCGFWAYDDRGFTAHGSVSGIIEGYGKTTIGTRGFRSEKARIVALSRERGERPLALSTWLRLQQIYPGVEFYENTDAMTLAHPSVLKEWDPIGEDFWDKPVKSPGDDMYLTFRGMNAAISRLQTSLRSTAGIWQVTP